MNVMNEMNEMNEMSEIGKQLLYLVRPETQTSITDVDPPVNLVEPATYQMPHP